jgi:hypothetical protein
VRSANSPTAKMSRPGPCRPHQRLRCSPVMGYSDAELEVCETQNQLAVLDYLAQWAVRDGSVAVEKDRRVADLFPGRDVLTLDEIHAKRAELDEKAQRLLAENRDDVESEAYDVLRTLQRRARDRVAEMRVILRRPSASTAPAYRARSTIGTGARRARRTTLAVAAHGPPGRPEDKPRPRPSRLARLLALPRRRQ